MAERAGVLEQTFLTFADFFRHCPIPSNPASCAENNLPSGFVCLRPFSDFASQMELEMELGPFKLAGGDIS